MPRTELRIAASQFPLLLFGIEAELVVPDVVLRQADVDVKGGIILCAGDEGLDGSRCADQTRLIIRVGYGKRLSQKVGECMRWAEEKGLDSRRSGTTGSCRPRNLPSR